MFLLGSLSSIAQTSIPRYELVTANGTDTYTATISPTPSLINGFTSKFKFTNANTGASTFNLSSTGAITLRKNDGTALVSGDIPAGSVWWIVYDGSASQWRLSSQTASVGNITGLGTGVAAALAVNTGSSGAFVVNGGTILSATTATTQSASDNSTRVATTAYVDNAILGQRSKEAVKYASTAALPSIVYSNGSSGVGATLTGVALAAISLDGNSPSINDRVLIKNQLSTFQNGIYTVSQTGSGIAVFILTRTTDFDQAVDIQTGDIVFVTSGSTLSTTTWAYNGGDNPVMGTDAITFVQVAGQGSFTAGNGITITGTSIAADISVLADKTTAQTLTNKTLASNTVATTQSALDGSTAVATTLYADNETLVVDNAQSGDYTLVLSDRNKNISMSKATAKTLTVPTNTSVAYAIGTVIWLTNTSSAQAGVLTIAGAGGVTVTGSSGALTDAGYNVTMRLWKTGTDTWKLDNGIPGTWFSWTPTFTGFSTPPTIASARYSLIGKTCFYYVTLSVNGTSDQNFFTMTLPFAAANTSIQHSLFGALDGGSFQTLPGRLATRVNSNIADLFKTVAGGNTWTSSGLKGGTISGQYEIN